MESVAHTPYLHFPGKKASFERLGLVVLASEAFIRYTSFVNFVGVFGDEAKVAVPEIGASGEPPNAYPSFPLNTAVPTFDEPVILLEAR